MRVTYASYNGEIHPPLLTFVIHDAPHRRVHIETIKVYRDVLRRALMTRGIAFPIDHPIDLDVTFINPTSTDNGNLYLALEQAMDGQTLVGPGIVTDDSLISENRVRKLYLNQPKRVVQPRNLPRFLPMPEAVNA